MQEYITIGVAKKPFGVKGEFKVNIEDAYLEDFMHTKVVFLEVKGKPLPFFVEDIRMAGALLLKLEEVDDKEAASKIGGSILLLRKEDLLADEDREMELEETLNFNSCLGYTIWDVTLGKIGSIKEVLEFPQQEMALVLYQERELLIPLHQNLIDSIDHHTQSLYMDLPEGLLDL